MLNLSDQPMVLLEVMKPLGGDPLKRTEAHGFKENIYWDSGLSFRFSSLLPLPSPPLPYSLLS